MSVLALAVAEKILVSEYYLAFTGGLCLAPFNVGADIFRFALGDAAVDGDVKLGTGLIAVDIAFHYGVAYIRLLCYKNILAVEFIGGQSVVGNIAVSVLVYKLLFD